MACSSTKTIDEIDDLYEMVKIMEALDISSRGCKTLDELKTQVITTLNQSQTKPNWAAGQVRIRLNFYGWKGNFAFGEWFEMAFHQDMLYPQRMYTQWLVILAYLTVMVRTRQTNLHPFWCQSLRLRWSSLNIETFSSHTDGEGIVLTAQPTTTETFIEETVCQY